MLNKVYVLAHTHWDREWYEPHEGFRLRLVEAVDKLLDLLEGKPGFRHFLLDAQAIAVRDYLEVRPEQAERLRRLVLQGRLEIGPWYVLADEFLVSGQALIRNLQLGLEWCERFARSSRVGYVPDAFGHPAQLPQILRGFGMEVAVASRGMGHEGAELWWEAPDGSRVLALHLRQGYGNLAWVPSRPDRFLRTFERRLEALRPHVRTGAAILLSGTDHLEPLAALPELLEAARRAHPELEIEHVSLEACARAIHQRALRSDRLPVVRGEQRFAQRAPVLPGTLSARIHLKQRNDAAQRLMERYAEPLAALAWALGGPDLRAQLRHAWQVLLENHPHDSICGCSVDAVHREMMTRFERVEQLGQRLVETALDSLAGRIDTRRLQPRVEADRAGTWRLRPRPAWLPVVVYNPVAHGRAGWVRVRLPTHAVLRRVAVVDASGSRLPTRWHERPRPEETRLVVSGEELREILERAREGQLFGRRIEDLALRVRGRSARLEVIQQFGEAAPPLDRIHDYLDRLAAEAPLEAVERARVEVRLSQERELEFLAPDLPPLGLEVFVLGPDTGAPPNPQGLSRARAAPAARAAMADGTPALENEQLRLEVDRRTGALTLIEKAGGLRFEGLNRFVEGGDAGDLYNYSPPPEDRLVTAPVRPPRIRLGDDALEVRLSYRVPARLTADRRGRRRTSVAMPITLRAWLTPGQPWLEVELSVDNRARDHRLQVRFPTPFARPRGFAETAFHVLERPAGGPPPGSDGPEEPRPEFPQAGWSALEEAGRGLMVANQGLPEMAFVRGEEGTEMVLTLLRCVGQISRGDLTTRRLYAGPPHATPEGQCPGRYTFRYALIPYTGGWREAAPLADAFRHRPHGAVAGWHDGALAPRHSFLGLEAGLSLSALKPAWSDERVVLTVWSSSDRPLEPPPLEGLEGLGAPERLDLAEKPIEGHPQAPIHPAEIRTTGYRLPPKTS